MMAPGAACGVNRGGQTAGAGEREEKKKATRVMLYGSFRVIWESGMPGLLLPGCQGKQERREEAKRRRHQEKKDFLMTMIDEIICKE